MKNCCEEYINHDKTNYDAYIQNGSNLFKDIA